MSEVSLLKSRVYYYTKGNNTNQRKTKMIISLLIKLKDLSQTETSFVQDSLEVVKRTF